MFGLAALFRLTTYVLSCKPTAQLASVCSPSKVHYRSDCTCTAMMDAETFAVQAATFVQSCCSLLCLAEMLVRQSARDINGWHAG